MKKWTRPQGIVEQFEANEYVAACVVGTIQCMYPGNGETNGQEVYDDYNGQESGWYRDNHQLLHGICGNDAPISFDSGNGSGYEVIGGKVQHDRPIWNISGHRIETGTYTVTWNSKDGSNTYSHKGRLVITEIDDTHPNRS